MKINCGLSNEEKDRLEESQAKEWYDRISVWHNWFAWYPVRVGSKDCRWLETVQRIGIIIRIYDYNCSFDGWKYKALELS